MTQDFNAASGPRFNSDGVQAAQRVAIAAADRGVPVRGGGGLQLLFRELGHDQSHILRHRDSHQVRGKDRMGDLAASGRWWIHVGS